MKTDEESSKAWERKKGGGGRIKQTIGDTRQLKGTSLDWHGDSTTLVKSMAALTGRLHDPKSHLKREQNNVKFSLY